MNFENNDEIKERIKDYSFKQLIETFCYISKCKCDLLKLKETELFKQDLFDYFVRIENCIYEQMFNKQK